MINLHDYEFKILEFLKIKKEAKIEDLVQNLKLNKDAILWAIQTLEQEKYITIENLKIFVITLSSEARKYLNEFPEEKLIRLLSNEKNKDSNFNIKLVIKNNNIGVIWAKKNKWLTIINSTIKVNEKSSKIIHYEQRIILNKLNEKSEQKQDFIEKNQEPIDNLIKRSLINIKEKNIINKIILNENKINELNNLKENKNEINIITKEFIKNYNNKEKTIFKKYDINADIERVFPARRHPLNLFINNIRKIFFELGFKEVSGPIVDTSFWVFDTLFSPQDHPTRDIQDTFFLSNPKEIDIIDRKLLDNVKKMHEENWKEKWSKEIAKQLILRTHTTNVSAHYMHELSKTNESTKLFTIGKIFRNESIDFKHLAEFHQVDGLMIGENLNFSNLIFLIKKFYKKLEPDMKIMIKPSYFPFVEPGLEINYIDENTNKAIELGGAGIIRKEIVNAMGLKNKNVLAFGLGIERLMFRVLPINSLIELYKNDIGMLRDINEIK